MSKMMKSVRRVFVASAMAAAGLVVVGCSTNTTAMPTDMAWQARAENAGVMRTAGAFFGGDNAVGRMATLAAESEDEMQATAGETMKSGAPIAALNEMIDAAAQEFARTLANNPLIRESEYQLVMIVDDFTNEAAGDNPALDNALKSVIRRLRRNDVLRNDFVFIAASDTAAKKILDNTSGDWDDFDPFGDGEDTTSIVKYHPDLIYALQGEMYKFEEFSNFKMQLVLTMEVIHPRTRLVSEDFEFTRTYRFHPDFGWITEERDAQLKAEYEAAQAAG